MRNTFQIARNVSRIVMACQGKATDDKEGVDGSIVIKVSFQNWFWTGLPVGT